MSQQASDAVMAVCERCRDNTGARVCIAWSQPGWESPCCGTVMRQKPLSVVHEQCSTMLHCSVEPQSLNTAACNTAGMCPDAA